MEKDQIIADNFIVKNIHRDGRLWQQEQWLSRV